jgi:hypothetical protein
MLFPPTSELDPAYWAAVAAGHVFVGLVLSALLSWITGRHVLSAVAVSVGYLLFWEWFWQGLGAGLEDAVVDSLFVSGGAILALYAYQRAWPKVALVMSASLAGILKGISKRL